MHTVVALIPTSSRFVRKARLVLSVEHQEETSVGSPRERGASPIASMDAVATQEPILDAWSSSSDRMTTEGVGEGARPAAQGTHARLDAHAGAKAATPHVLQEVRRRKRFSRVIKCGRREPNNTVPAARPSANRSRRRLRLAEGDIAGENGNGNDKRASYRMRIKLELEP